MKALILAAGFGTRLRPYTELRPKALFTIAGRPLIDIHIALLIEAGCQEIAVNTHYLGDQISNYLNNRAYDIPVHVFHEPEILGTGGAVRNLKNFWDQSPFFIVNADIVTDISLTKVYQFHLEHPHPVSLVLCDAPEHNSVTIDEDHFICSFIKTSYPLLKKYTFTGIQVVDPIVIQHIPADTFISSIQIYQRLMNLNHRLKAYLALEDNWEDIGTAERYIDLNRRKIAMNGFKKRFMNSGKIEPVPLKGDGSDRAWTRWQYKENGTLQNFVMAEHGISLCDRVNEVDSFVYIGNYLYKNQISVPKIIDYDLFAGIVLLEDLGDLHLQQVANTLHSDQETITLYKAVVDQLIQMSKSFYNGFNTEYCYQTPQYDQSFIMEKECRYFLEAFIQQYMGMDCPGGIMNEFELIATNATSYGYNGLMHRDFQSRNIMIACNRPYFIDFQGGRFGPLQYDLASLLIDPYVKLSQFIQTGLLAYCTDQLFGENDGGKKDFMTGYKYCALARNLQILGAFGFLTKVKNKEGFKKYIPHALKFLYYQLSDFKAGSFPLLIRLVEKAHIKL